MSPRAPVQSGIPGPGQDVFPEAAKESGRNLGLRDEATIYEDQATDDGGGSSKSKWVEVGTVRARLDSIATAKATGLIADQINEESTHIVSFDPETPVTTGSRIKIKEKMWAVTGKRDTSDPLIERVEVKGV